MKFHPKRISYFVLLLLVVSIGVTPAFAQSNLYGIVYSPMKKDSIFEDLVKDDISIISTFTKNIRLYKIDDNTQKILENAKQNNIKVILGIDLENSDKVQSDIQKAIKFSQDYSGLVDSIIIGNDAIAEKQVSMKQLEEYLLELKENHITVSSANSPYIWQQNPTLVDKVDYIMMYSFDFWQGLDAKQAAQNAILQYDTLKEKYPDKSIIVETGWPSNGNLIRDAIPSEQIQSDYIKNFVTLANQRKIQYYLFEYANESWKPEKNNNTVENHWGLLYEKERMVKPYLTGLFEFQSVKYVTTIQIDGQTNYKPITNTDDDKNKILKVIIPKDVSSVSYQVSDQAKIIETNGKQTILFIKSNSQNDIVITTNKHSDKLEFSLIPQAFAACSPDVVCYEINQDSSDYLLSILLASGILGIISLVLLRRHIFKPKEWDSISIKQINLF